MRSLIRFLTHGLEAVCAIILAVLTTMVFTNVILRYFFNSGITVTEEFGRFLFVWLVFGAAILVAATNSHVKVDFLLDHLSPRLRRVLYIVGDVVMIFLCYMIVDGGIKQTRVTMDNISPVSGLPLGWLPLALTVAGTVIGLIILNRMCKRIAGTYPPPDQKTEEEEIAAAAKKSAAAAAAVAEEKGID